MPISEAKFVVDQRVVERLVSHATLSIEGYLQGWNDWGDRGCESPIEKIFFMAFELWGKIDYPFALERFPIEMTPQAQVLGRRVDFLITVCEHRLIVECDGHDFHERTKDQAARDRSANREFQASGFTIYRFTGRELWADPMKCAGQAWGWAIQSAAPARLSTDHRLAV